MDNFTIAEQIRLKLICKIQEIENNSYSIRQISRLLVKDRRTIKKCIMEFRELFRTKNFVLLYIFIEKYINIDISELSSFVNVLLKDIEAVENSVYYVLSWDQLEEW